MQISGLSASNTFSATDVLAIEVNVNGTNKTYKLTGATLATALASIGSYLKATDVVNNLTSTDPTKVLAAPQGKALAERPYIVYQWVSFLYYNSNQLVGTYTPPSVPSGYTYRLLCATNIFNNDPIGIKFSGAFLLAPDNKLRAEGSGFISTDTADLLVVFMIYKT